MLRVIAFGAFTVVNGFTFQEPHNNVDTAQEKEGVSVTADGEIVVEERYPKSDPQSFLGVKSTKEEDNEADIDAKTQKIKAQYELKREKQENKLRQAELKDAEWKAKHADKLKEAKAAQKQNEGTSKKIREACRGNDSFGRDFKDWEKVFMKSVNEHDDYLKHQDEEKELDEKQERTEDLDGDMANYQGNSVKGEKREGKEEQRQAHRELKERQHAIKWDRKETKAVQRAARHLATKWGPPKRPIGSLSLTECKKALRDYEKAKRNVDDCCSCCLIVLAILAVIGIAGFLVFWFAIRRGADNSATAQSYEESESVEAS